MYNQPSIDGAQKHPRIQSGMISADSHAVEPPDLWDGLPADYRALVPPQRARSNNPDGATDPRARLADQARDGIATEILFPHYGMGLFHLGDAGFQTAAFRTYNDWLAEYCSIAPRNLVGVPSLQAYDIDAAITEMHRAHDLGLKGAMIWQVPDPKLPFTSPHYEKLWAAAAESGAPLHFHILTGHSYAQSREEQFGAERIRGAVNQKAADTITTLFDMIFSGAFDRHRKLKIVLVESEIGWIPFMLQQWDYYYHRFGKTMQMPISRLPSEIFAEHVYGTFIDDFSGTRALSWWGEDNCLWSSDYPHFNTSYPNSVANVERHLGHLPEATQRKLVRDNAINLYKLEA